MNIFEEHIKIPPLWEKTKISFMMLNICNLNVKKIKNISEIYAVV